MCTKSMDCCRTSAFAVPKPHCCTRASAAPMRLLCLCACPAPTPQPPLRQHCSLTLLRHLPCCTPWPALHLECSHVCRILAAAVLMRLCCAPSLPPSCPVDPATHGGSAEGALHMAGAAAAPAVSPAACGPRADGASSSGEEGVRGTNASGPARRHRSHRGAHRCGANQ